VSVLHPAIRKPCCFLRARCESSRSTKSNSKHKIGVGRLLNPARRNAPIATDFSAIGQLVIIVGQPQHIATVSASFIISDRARISAARSRQCLGSLMLLCDMFAALLSLDVKEHN